MPVVRKTMIIIEPGDVLKIVVRCSECKREVVYAPDSSVPDFRSCRVCPSVTAWDSNNDGDKKQRSETIKLFEALHYFWSEEYRKRKRDSESNWDISLVLPGDFD